MSQKSIVFFKNLQFSSSLCPLGVYKNPLKTRSTGPQKLSFDTPVTIIDGFLIKNSSSQNRKERPNQSTNNNSKNKFYNKFLITIKLG